MWDQKKRQKNNPGMGGRSKRDCYSPVEKVRRERTAKLRGIWKDWIISTQRKRIGRMFTIHGSNVLHWLMDGRGGSQMTRQIRICLGCGG
jgi:hypothetical protein